ncbi:NUDIX hydrolase, partial [Alistipes putredinis]|nr:NUDIX hydrolase [Alistipes putredinis]
VLLVRQFRKAIEKVLWEIPAGKLEQGESPKDCAIRELKEETGYSANNMKLIHKFYTSSGFSNQKIYVYLDTDL